MQVKVESWSLYVLIEEVKPVAEAYPHNADVALIWPRFGQSAGSNGGPRSLAPSAAQSPVQCLKFTREGSVRW